MRPLAPWPVSGRPVDELMAELGAALDGTGPALAPLGAAELGGPAALPEQVPDPVALVVHTSGSTGTARGVLLDGDALLASARTTHARLGGPGRWLLALPTHHVAGLQVLVRSVLAGRSPATAEPGDLASIARAAAGDGDGPAPRYASLVPTQLHRAVSAAQQAGGLDAAGLGPLARLEAILVGGAATGADLLARARDLGLPVVTTYGSTETCGGCVYDGVPLDGVEVRLDDGVVLLTGPVLARGYLDGGPGFEEHAGRRWFRTADLGRLVEGRLEVLGRRDDVLVVGGVNVSPHAVEQVLAALPGIGEVCVVGLPSERWGQVPVAVVVPESVVVPKSAAGTPGAVGTPGTVGTTVGTTAPGLDRVREAVLATLGSAAAPRRLVVVDRLPLRGPGKVDRAAVARLAAHDTAD